MTSPSSREAVEQAWSLLREGRPAQEAAARVEGVRDDDPMFPHAQHLKAVCALQQGDVGTAKALIIDAVRRGAHTLGALLQLAQVTALAGGAEDGLLALLDVLKRGRGDQLGRLLPQLLQTLRFSDNQARPDKDAAFSKLVLPLLADLLARREMDAAIVLESIIYNWYVKTTETEAHFGRCMAQIAPLFTEAGHHWREVLPPLPRPALVPPYRVGFFLHNASTLAHIQMLLATLKGYRSLADQPFEPMVYCFAGHSPPMEQALADVGVRLVMLPQRFPDARGSPWQLLLKLRELLAEEGVQELVWVSLVVMMPLAFSLRMAPVQTWFAMKYHNFSHPEIDGYLSSAGPASQFGALDGQPWRTAMLGGDRWYDSALAGEAARIRASLDARVVLMTLARTEKMQDPAYLSAVTTLLRAHPDAMFIWAGREESPAVAAAFKAAGVFEQTRFIGWVDTLLYAQVGDIFVDTFPFPCGFTLMHAMAAGKPTVFYDSPEGRQGYFLRLLLPRLEGDEGTPEERAELRAIVGGPEDPLIPIARTPQEYVRYLSRLIEDDGARAAAGEAARRFVQRYYSDASLMAASLARHMVELIEERRAAAA